MVADYNLALGTGDFEFLVVVLYKGRQHIYMIGGLYVFSEMNQTDLSSLASMWNVTEWQQHASGDSCGVQQGQGYPYGPSSAARKHATLRDRYGEALWQHTSIGENIRD